MIDMDGGLDLKAEVDEKVTAAVDVGVAPVVIRCLPSDLKPAVAA